ncbi:uracil-xanthine permease family protein [Tepidibacter formicigenes]|jgi:uracil permease|uniref:Uracil permease n=1 Tax=Tepidibacter formicigenes DSM 15518 TaxID=1123349 RepID=A0A1M6KFT7_9FIRM|nr:uracil-xanthine permease family protein [Tepidibacter formicigenes]SHJ57784.1 uracil permease [Tepidibacter formicigenes DSM 15518]
MQQKILNPSVNKSFELSKNFKKVVLAMQHLLAMFGATVLVPILTGFDPSVALISAGLGTLIFHLVTKGMVPVFLGSSFAFIPVILTVKEIYNGDLTYAQGGIVVAGILYVIMSFIVKKVGVDKVKKYFPAQVTGPMIVVIGLNLVPVAINMASGNYIVSVATLSIALLVTFLGRGFIKQLSILIAVTVGYIISLKLGIVDTNVIKEASWVLVPNFTLPKFEMGAIAIIAPVVLAVFMEHIGDITTNGAVVGKNFIENPGLNRTLIGDGLATIIGGFIGGPANTTYGENTGVLAITKNYDPSILRITAVLAVILGCINKVGSFLQTIPTPVMGGISLMLFSMIAIIGIKTVRNGSVEFKTSNIIIISLILIIGLGTNYLQNKGIVIGIPVTSSVKITGLSLAAIVGVVLNKLLNKEKIGN